MKEFNPFDAIPIMSHSKNETANEVLQDELFYFYRSTQVTTVNIRYLTYPFIQVTIVTSIFIFMTHI